MFKTLSRIGILSLSVGAFAYAGSLIFPAFHSLGNDETPAVPLFTSTRIANGFVPTEQFSQFNAQMEKFVQKWGIVGLSVAVAKDDKLVFTKAYGYADKEDKQAAQPYNLFRVASISKLITAVGIMKLVEEGHLSLDTKIFGEDGILNDSLFQSYIDKRVELITIKMLLEHSAGWTHKYGDHMFMPSVVAKKLNKDLPVSDGDIIKFALMHKLHFQPGESSSYSNLGYAVLGKVIEEVSGKSYEEYIKANVFIPLGIYDACIGGSYFEERKEFEVKYYEADCSILVEDYRGSGMMVPRSYGGNDIRTLGAAGGWICSSTDLIKLMLAINGNPSFKDILQPNSIEAMTRPESANKSPLGWRRVNSLEWVRTGTLASTSALMVHRIDGISYVVLSNTGSWKGADFTSEIERQMNRSLTSLNQWPDYDLLKLDFSTMQPIKSRSSIIF